MCGERLGVFRRGAVRFRHVRFNPRFNLTFDAARLFNDRSTEFNPTGGQIASGGATRILTKGKLLWFALQAAFCI